MATRNDAEEFLELFMQDEWLYIEEHDMESILDLLYQDADESYDFNGMDKEHLLNVINDNYNGEEGEDDEEW